MALFVLCAIFLKPDKLDHTDEIIRVYNLPENNAGVQGFGHHLTTQITYHSSLFHSETRIDGIRLTKGYLGRVELEQSRSLPPSVVEDLSATDGERLITQGIVRSEK